MRSFALFLMTIALSTGILFGGDGDADERMEMLSHPEKATEKAPETFRVEFNTTKGSFTVLVNRKLSPLGADRLYNLVRMRYFEKVPFYRVLDDFVAQFGFTGIPEIDAKWMKAKIKDDPVQTSNVKGTLVFATGGRDGRSTQFFINTRNNNMLDNMGFSPLGAVEGDGMNVILNLHVTGEGTPRGPGPSQMRIWQQGWSYLGAEPRFAPIDYIKSAKILPVEAPAAEMQKSSDAEPKQENKQ